VHVLFIVVFDELLFGTGNRFVRFCLSEEEKAWKWLCLSVAVFGTTLILTGSL